MDPQDKKVPLMEVFGPVIQGEGHVIGQQTYFLRLGACDYRCRMCDSMHAVDPLRIQANAMWLTQREILEKFLELRPLTSDTTPWVTLSGGNPCIHDLSELVTELVHIRVKIAVETQGTIWQSWLSDCDVITVSPKGPGMGERFDKEIFTQFMLQTADTKPHASKTGLNIKVVVFGEEDIAFARGIFLWCTQYNFPLERFYLSQGNPWPPGADQSIVNLEEHTEELRYSYLKTFELIQNDPLLSRLKFLPQWHVWLHGNKAGV